MAPGIPAGIGGKAGIALLIGLFSAGAAAAPQASVRVFAQPQEALDRVLSWASERGQCVVQLPQGSRERLSSRLSPKDLAKPVTVYWGRSQEKTSYAVVDEEVGKYYPFTFLITMDQELRVSHSELLIYRESHGHEIRHKAFQKQYQGRSPSNSARLRKDIVNIAGATLSVQAMNRGVARILQVLEEARRLRLCPFQEEAR